MSIAVSAVVKPSRSLLALVASVCLVLIIAAAVIALTKLGKLSSHQRFLLAGTWIFLALLGFFRAFWKRKTFRIDISGIGQIRLTQDYGMAVLGCPGKRGNGEKGGEVVQLLEDSTLWPRLLLLRLQAGKQPAIVLPILTDSVSPEEFRALAVACRWIAAHNICADGEAG